MTEVSRERRGSRWSRRTFVGLLIVGAFLTLPFVLLGEWTNARNMADPFAFLVLGWALKGEAA